MSFRATARHGYGVTKCSKLKFNLKLFLLKLYCIRDDLYLFGDIPTFQDGQGKTQWSFTFAVFPWHSLHSDKGAEKMVSKVSIKITAYFGLEGGFRGGMILEGGDGFYLLWVNTDSPRNPSYDCPCFKTIFTLTRAYIHKRTPHTHTHTHTHTDNDVLKTSLNPELRWPWGLNALRLQKTRAHRQNTIPLGKTSSSIWHEQHLEVCSITPTTEVFPEDTLKGWTRLDIAIISESCDHDIRIFFFSILIHFQHHWLIASFKNVMSQQQ